jgi:hypothetical protein
MSSNNRKSNFSHPSSASEKERGKKKRAPKRAPRGGQQASNLFTAEFQGKVERLDKLMQLAATPKTKPPPGFVLMRDPERAPGTLEEVGHEADKAWAGVKRIMQLLNVEQKHCFYSGSQTVNQSGVVQDLSGQISQGVGGAQRTGDSLKCAFLRGRFRAASQGQYNTVQIVVGRSKDGIPSAADLFQLVGSAQSGLSFQNDDQDKANTFLYHSIVLVAPSTAVAAVYRECELKIDQDTLFVAGTTTATSGALWCAMISDAAASLPTCEFAFDIEFVDN